MDDQMQSTKSGASKTLWLIIILLVALGVGYFIWQEQQETGVSLQIGDKEFSATVDENELP